MRDDDSTASDRGDDAGFDQAATEAEICVADGDETSDSERSNPVLILDSGATCHATGDRRLLSDFAVAAALLEEYAAAGHRTRDGKELPIAGAGTGTVASGKFQIPGVLYVPGLPSGTVLVSVQQLAALGYLVMFGGGQCLVMDQSGGKLVGQGRLQQGGGLYLLESLQIPLDAAADGTA